ncbi:MAG TPA: OB-fold nucleic acid binding domain-containing protein, partial [Methylomirabilota bacterium]|nr:OB-fold nucleic acid binding domain-containing protein [Methylomirabilota bacterium]
DPPTFELMQRADTIGVFQIESRAQMATLPRMKPGTFYDLVIEVAIIRPGPIVGDLAHPYLRRRNGEEPVTYYAPELVPILERTLGVPLFQEQMLQMAMVMAHLTGDEAEELRRAMSFHRSDERMTRARARLRAAMDRAGVRADVAERIAQAVGSFALYGFPESHAISFAHLAYASAYLKAHRAPEFFCALLNHQPMGFYSPATLIRDAKRRGVQVRPVCVARSEWECVIEADASIRLGLLQVEGLRRDPAQAMLEERSRRPFASLEDFKSRTAFSKEEIRTLAGIGALNCLAPHRRAALWEAERPRREGDLFGDLGHTATSVAEVPLRAMNPLERLRADYAGLRLTTGQHPMALVRDRLPGICRAGDLPGVEDGRWVRVAGQVICRQRPGSAKGVCFLSLEDETGISNVIVAPPLFEAERLTFTTEAFLIIEGVVQSRHGVIHIKARSVRRLPYAGLQAAQSHDFG